MRNEVVSTSFQNTLGSIPAMHTRSMESLSKILTTLRLSLSDISRKSEVSIELPRVSAKESDLFGLEVEIERVQGAMEGWSSFVTEVFPWSLHGDGSLRNHGCEFISRAASYEDMRRMIPSLFLLIKKYSPNADFSWRTSIHVHMNVRDLTATQLMDMIILYLIFENSLFQYASASRKQSIFCVPLLESKGVLRKILSLWDAAHKNKGPSFRSSIIDLQTVWEKYGSLGIFQLRNYGTLEFRHFPGTWDVKKILGWLGLIQQLKNCAREITHEELVQTILTINTLSHYSAFREAIFGDSSQLLNFPTFEGDVAVGVMRLKEILYHTPAKNLVGRRANGITRLIKEEERKYAEKKKEHRAKIFGRLLEHARGPRAGTRAAKRSRKLSDGGSVYSEEALQATTFSAGWNSPSVTSTPPNVSNAVDDEVRF